MNQPINRVKHLALQQQLLSLTILSNCFHFKHYKFLNDLCLIQQIIHECFTNIQLISLLGKHKLQIIS